MKRRVSRHLIEFLVVGLLIASVAAVLVTVNIRATGKARALQCASNVHQLTLALQQYADDYDSQLPLGRGWQALTLTYSERPEDPRLNLFTCSARARQPGFAFGLNYDVAGRGSDSVAPQVWLTEVRNGSDEIWWVNDLRFHRLAPNRLPVAPHRLRASVSRGDGSVRTMDPLELAAQDWLPPVRQPRVY